MSGGLSMFRSEKELADRAVVPERHVSGPADMSQESPLVCGVLIFIGWANLLVGVLVGFVLMTMGAPGPLDDANWVLIGLGAGLVGESVISCALFRGLASLVENLAAIRRRLESPAVA